MTHREDFFQKVKCDYVPGTHFRVKMRQGNSREHNGKMYRYFTVLAIYDDMFLCQAEGNFKETFSAWDMCHKAEKVACETGNPEKGDASNKQKKRS